MEEILHHLGCVKPCKYWDKLPTSLAGFLNHQQYHPCMYGIFTTIHQISKIHALPKSRNTYSFPLPTLKGDSPTKHPRFSSFAHHDSHSPVVWLSWGVHFVLLNILDDIGCITTAKRTWKNPEPKPTICFFDTTRFHSPVPKTQIPDSSVSI